MRARVHKVVLLILVPVIYWSATAAMIENSARCLSTNHSCIIRFPFNHAEFLISMGNRSVPTLRRQIVNPNIDMISQTHLVWVLSHLGDYSQFQVFINGLSSKKQRHQYIAAVRMQDFPQECLRWLPAILAAGRQKQHFQYWNLLTLLSYKASLSEDKREILVDILYGNGVQEKGLSHQEVQDIIQLFETPKNYQKN